MSNEVNSNSVEQLITQHIDIWGSSILAKSTSGRGSSKKYELYGIQKLRELILELAVQGKLVNQEADDESVDKLIAKIEEEKSLLIKNKIIRKSKPLGSVTDEEAFFEIPSSWRWVRLNEIGDWGAGATPLRSKSEYYGGDIPWFKSGELNQDYISKSEETITELALKETSLRENKPGDVLIAMYGATIGKASILQVPATTNQAVCACTPFTGIDNEFLLVLLKAYRKRFISMGAGGAQPNISRVKIVSTAAPLPPLAEQKRIVAKVDELMQLCDQLEQQTESSIDAHATLVEVLLNTLTDSKDADELAQNWSRLANNFDIIFTTEQSIEALKQTILQLAVMGKLVPQGADDEPALVLIERVAKEKDQLVKEKKIRKPKKAAKISNNEKPFTIPDRWIWVRLQDIGRDWGQKKPDAEFTYIDVGSINKELGVIGSPYILGANDAPSRARKLVKEGTVIYSTVRPYLLNIAIIDKIFEPEPIASTAFAIIHPLGGISSRFVYYYLRSSTFIDYVESCQTGMAYPAINDKKFFDGIIPIPPVAEQERIVAKVDELMAICDQLKEQLQKSQQTQANLTDALVDQALS